MPAGADRWGADIHHDMREGIDGVDVVMMLRLQLERMTGALTRARVQAAGHEAGCVSHQLPVETLRRSMNDLPLHHFPTRRMCGLASVTSFYFDDDRYVGWGYSELGGR